MRQLDISGPLHAGYLCVLSLCSLLTRKKVGAVPHPIFYFARIRPKGKKNQQEFKEY